MVEITLPVGLCVFGIGLLLAFLGLTGRIRYSESVSLVTTLLLLGGFIMVLINFIIIVLRYLIIGS